MARRNARRYRPANDRDIALYRSNMRRQIGALHVIRSGRNVKYHAEMTGARAIAGQRRRSARRHFHAH